MKRNILVSFLLLLGLFLTTAPSALAIELDQRIGVNHVGGAYPNRLNTGDYLTWGAERAYDLGFRNLTVMMMRNLCVIRPHHPKGLYQTQTYCHDTLERTQATDLATLAKNPLFVSLFAKPFRRFFIFTDSLNPEAANQEQIGELTALTQPELDKTYTDYYAFTTYLLETYANTNKTFILIAPSELDHRLKKRSNCTPVTAGAPTSCFDIEPPAIPVENAKKYLATISNAIHTATQDHPTQGIRVYHACELNSVARTSLRGIQSAIDLVIPSSHCDLIGYSAFESFLEATPTKTDLMTQSLTYIANKTPNHPSFGNKNVFLSQFGIRENVEPDTRFSLFTDSVNQALTWGVPFVQFWTLHDDNCNDQFPAANSDCVGFWMKKPNNANSKIYDYIVSHFSTLSPTITATPTPPTSQHSADLVDTGDTPGNQVNQHDADKLKADFGKTGTPGWILSDINDDGRVDVFDYNELVTAFGN